MFQSDMVRLLKRLESDDRFQRILGKEVGKQVTSRCMNRPCLDITAAAPALIGAALLLSSSLPLAVMLWHE